MKAAQKPCIFLENAVCLLVPNETDNGACLTVTRFPQGHIAQKFRDLTKRSLFCVRSSFEPQAHDSLGISALSGSWESRLVLAGLVLLLPWPVPHLRRCCRLGLVGLALTSLQLAWHIDSLPAHHIARVLPSLPRHVTVEGTLERAV